ncbi:MAG TPA: class I SAM-dependent methyltransferase [Tepidisphaeraceae bacterium]
MSLATLVPAAQIHTSTAPPCRFCGTSLKHTFVDLGTSPLCQRHVTPQRFNYAESTYPLHVYVCHQCMLVQLPQYVAREEIFDGEYAYFSSFSDTWLNHAQNYVAKMVDRFGYNANSRVVEVASNDGYLLQYFVQRGIPALGIEPTANTAAAAEQKGVKSLVCFFGRDTAADVKAEHGPADLLLGNNVLAHVPDINDFVGGMKILLSDRGVVTVEFPVLSKLVENNYFDTIYHEHFSYLSFTTVEQIFKHHGLTVFDVEQLPTHGGSIRVYARHTENTAQPICENVAKTRTAEREAGHFDLAYYAAFGEKVRETKRKILDFLIQAKRDGKTVAAYGAPGKGNTLLNYCGVRTDFIDFTVDRSPHKQGNFLPGSRLPILSPAVIAERKPDYLFILVWNLKDEVMKQMSFIREWGGKFVVPLPQLEVID